jgi:hypothetical protein
MMNIFQYLDYYIQNQVTNYGSIDNKDNYIDQFLSNDEKTIYEQIKKSDRNRLIKFS